MPDKHVPQNITRLEKKVYSSIKKRCKFVGLTMDELCARSGIAPSTFSRWVNGHNSGYIKTVGRMDDILTGLESDKFHQYEIRAKGVRLSLSDLCSHIEVPLHDYLRWVQKELDPDYHKLSILESFLTELETNLIKEPEYESANRA